MFTMTNGQLQVDPNLVATIPEIRQIWDRDQTEDKTEALAFLGFVFHLYNPKSTFHRQYTIDQRPYHIIQATFPPHLHKWAHADDPLITRLLKHYHNYLNLSPVRILLEDAERTIFDLSSKLQDVKTKNKQALLKQIRGAVEDLEYLRQKTNDDEEKREATRGNRVILKREDPKYKPLFVPKAINRQPIPFDGPATHFIPETESK